MSAQVHAPEQEQIDHWLKVARDDLKRTEEDLRTGFYEREDIPLQLVHVGTAETYADLGRAMFLNGEPVEAVREEFRQAARLVLKSFRMAYDPSDPDYVGDRPPPPGRDPGWGELSLAAVSENEFIEGAHWALMGADPALARELAEWYREAPDPEPDDEVGLGYARMLSAELREVEKLARQYARVQMEWCTSRELTELYETNLCTMSQALAGIVRRDAKAFNAGLAAQLEDYRLHMEPETRDTDEEFICDAAVALANLGLFRGLEVTVSHPLLPPGLLIAREPPASA